MKQLLLSLLVFNSQPSIAAYEITNTDGVEQAIARKWHAIINNNWFQQQSITLLKRELLADMQIIAGKGSAIADNDLVYTILSQEKERAVSKVVRSVKKIGLLAPLALALLLRLHAALCRIFIVSFRKEYAQLYRSDFIIEDIKMYSLCLAEFIVAAYIAHEIPHLTDAFNKKRLLDELMLYKKT